MKKILRGIRYIIIPILNRSVFRRLGIKVVAYSILPVSESLFSKHDFFSLIFEDLKNRNIEGDVIECGFGYGRSFSILSYLARKHSRKICSFDSFTGFPHVNKNDKSSRNPKVGQFNARSLKEAQEFANSLKLQEDKDYTIQKVIFDEKAKNPIPNTKIALLFIDLDLYIGYKYSLKLFWDQVSSGGIVAFDEYNEVKWPGATLAINEFLSSMGYGTTDLIQLNNKYYLIKK